MWPRESAVVTGLTCYTHCLMHAGVRAGHPHRCGEAPWQVRSCTRGCSSRAPLCFVVRLGPTPCTATDQRFDIALLPCSTDALILLKVLVHHGVPLEQAAAKLPDLQAAMVAHFQANKQVRGVVLRKAAKKRARQESKERKQACFSISVLLLCTSLQLTTEQLRPRSWLVRAWSCYQACCRCWRRWLPGKTSRWAWSLETSNRLDGVRCRGGGGKHCCNYCRQPVSLHDLHSNVLPLPTHSVEPAHHAALPPSSLPGCPCPPAAKMDALGIRHLFTQIGQPPTNFGGFSTGTLSLVSCLACLVLPL